MGDTPGAVPGPILAVSGTTEELGKLRDSLRDEIAQLRAAIAEGQAGILADQEKALNAQDDAEEEAAKKRIARARSIIGEQRAAIQQLAVDVQRASAQLPKIPLKVEIQGVSQEVLTVLRDEFGQLLGPLNGVTGRISSLISLLKLLSNVGKESGEGAAKGIKTIEVSAQGAANAIKAIGEQHVGATFADTFEKNFKKGFDDVAKASADTAAKVAADWAKVPGGGPVLGGTGVAPTAAAAAAAPAIEAGKVASTEKEAADVKKAAEAQTVANVADAADIELQKQKSQVTQKLDSDVQGLAATEQVFTKQRKEGVETSKAATKAITEEGESLTKAGVKAKEFGTIANETGKAAILIKDGSAAAAAEVSALGSAGTAAQSVLTSLGLSLGSVVAIAAVAASAVAIVTAALFEFGKESAEAARDFELMGQRIGATGQQVQGLSLVAKLGGSSLEELVLSLQRLDFSLTGHGGAGRGAGGEEGVAGSAGRAQQAIQFLIGSVKDASGQTLPSIEIFKRLAGQFSAMPDGVEKTSLAMEIFGHRGASLIPVLNKGAEGIQQLIEEANRLGIVIDEQGVKQFEEYERAVGGVTLAWGKFKQELGDVGVFSVVTSVIEIATKVLNAFGDAAGSAGRRYAQEFLKVVTEGKDKTAAAVEQKSPDLLGIEQYTKESKEKLEVLSKAVGDIRAHTLFPSTSSALGSGLRDEIEGLVAEEEKITDAGDRKKKQDEDDLLIRQKLLDNGVLQRVGQEELNRLIDQTIQKKKEEAFAAEGGPAEILKLIQEGEKAELKVSELNDKYNILGNTVGTAFQKSTLSVAATNKAALEAYNNLERAQARLKELQNPPTVQQSGVSDADREKARKQAEIDVAKAKLDVIGTQQAAVKAAELAGQANQEAINKTKELQNQYKELVKAIDELNQRTVDETTKQLSAAKQVQVYSDNVAILKTKLDDSLSAFEALNAKLPGASSAFLSLADAQSRVVEANKAIDESQTAGAARIGDLQAKYLSLKASLDATNLSDTERNRIDLEAVQAKAALDAEIKRQADELDDLYVKQREANLALNAAITLEESLTKGDAAANAQLQLYVANLREYKTQIDGQIASRRAQKSADDAAFESGDRLVTKTGELSKETQKLRKQLSEVGDKQKQLPEQVEATIKKIEEEAQEIARLTAQLELLKKQNAAPAQIEATQTQLNTALKEQISNTKELADEQTKLKENTVTVASAWKDFSEVVQGFGVALPKSLVRVVAMIEAVVKLTQAIERYKLAQEAQQLAEKKGFELREGKTGLAAGQKSVGEQVAEKSPEVKSQEAVISSLTADRASTDANTEATRENTAALQASGANQGIGNLTQEGVSPGAQGLPPLEQPAGGLGQGLGETGGPAAAPAAETATIASGIPGGGGGGAGSGLSHLLGGGGAAAGVGLIAGGAGLGAALGKKIGGTTGEVGGAIAGAGAAVSIAALSGSAVAAALGPLVLLGPIGALIGAAILAIGIVKQKLDAEAATIAKHIEEGFKAITKAYQDGAVTLNQTIQEVVSLQQQSIQKLSGQKGGGAQLFKLLPQFATQLAQLQKQSQDVIKQFDTDLGASRFALGIQSTISQIQQLNQQITDFINAGGNASQAAEFLARSLNSIEINTQQNLLQTEQGVVSLLLQQIDLRKQAAQLIHDEAQQEKDILNQGVIDRTRSRAQDDARQILQLRQQRDLQLKDINQQIAQNQAQIGDAQKLFGLTLNQNSLLQDQLKIQRLLTETTEEQVAAEQKLLAALQGIGPGGTQVDLNKILQLLGGATGVPGLPAPTGGPTAAPFDSSAFLAELESTRAGIKELEKLFGTVPTQITAAQEQQILTASQGIGTLKPLLKTLSDIMAQEIAAQKQLENALPGGASPTLPYQPVVDALDTSKTTTASNTSAVQNLTKATQEQTAAIRGTSGPTGPTTSTGEHVITAAAPAAGPSLPVVGTVSDALSSNQLVPVAVVGGNLGSVGEIGSLPSAEKTAAGATGGVAPSPVAAAAAAGTLSAAPGGVTLPPGSPKPAVVSIATPTAPVTTIPTAPAPAPTPPTLQPTPPTPTPAPAPTTGPSQQLALLGAIKAGSHPAQLQIDAAVQQINEIIGAFNAASITGTDALNQIKKVETTLEQALSTVRKGTPSFATADTAIKALEAQLQSILSKPAPAPTSPTTPTVPTAPTTPTAPPIPSLPATGGPSEATGAIIAAIGGYTLFGHDSFGAPVYIDAKTGQLYNSLGEPLSPSTQVSPLLASTPAPSSPTGPTPVGPAPTPTPTPSPTPTPTPAPPVTVPPISPPVFPPVTALPPIGVIQAGSHPAQVQVDAAIELINSIITGYNAGTLSAQAALAQITTQEATLKAALANVRKGTPSFATADAAIQAAISALQNVIAQQNAPPSGPTPPATITQGATGPNPQPTQPTGIVATGSFGPTGISTEVATAPSNLPAAAASTLVSIGEPGAAGAAGEAGLPGIAGAPATAPATPRFTIIPPTAPPTINVPPPIAGAGGAGGAAGQGGAPGLPGAAGAPAVAELYVTAAEVNVEAAGGAAGAAGVPGAAGIPGVTGAPGLVDAAEISVKQTLINALHSLTTAIQFLASIFQGFKVGAAGSPGAAGLPGSAGAAGAAGIGGAAGPIGAPAIATATGGAAGSPGAPGVAGAPALAIATGGAAGPAGAPAIATATGGAAGAPGAAGVAGLPGAVGSAGIAGAPATAIATVTGGAAGAAGATGLPGAVGAAGVTGPVGASVVAAPSAPAGTTASQTFVQQVQAIEQQVQSGAITFPQAVTTLKGLLPAANALGQQFFAWLTQIIEAVQAAQPKGLQPTPGPTSPTPPPLQLPNIGQIGAIRAGSAPAQTTLDASIKQINQVVSQLNTGGVNPAQAEAQIQAIQTALQASLSDVRKGTPTLTTATPIIQQLLTQIQALPNQQIPATTGGPVAPGTKTSVGTPTPTQISPLGPIQAGSHPAQVDLDAAIAEINQAISAFNSGALSGSQAITEIQGIQATLQQTLSDVRKGTPTLATANPQIDALIKELQNLPQAVNIGRPQPGKGVPPGPIQFPTPPQPGAPPSGGPPPVVACPGVGEEFTAPFLPIIQAASNLISEGTGATPAAPPVTPAPIPPTGGPIIRPVGPEPVFPRFPIPTQPTAPTSPVVPTQPTAPVPPTQPTSPIRTLPQPIFENPILLSKIDSIQSVLAAAAARLPATAPAISLGGVTVNIQGTTNMSSAQLQDAVTKGLNAGFNELRGRRGVNPIGT